MCKVCCQAIWRGDLVTVARADHGHSHHVHRILKVFQSPNNAATQNKWFSENSAKALSLSSSSSRSSSSLPSWASSTLPPSASSPPGIAIQAALVRISSHSHTWRRKIWERWQFSQKMMMKYVTPMAMTTTIWLKLLRAQNCYPIAAIYFSDVLKTMHGNIGFCQNQMKLVACVGATINSGKLCWLDISSLVLWLLEICSQLSSSFQNWSRLSSSFQTCSKLTSSFQNWSKLSSSFQNSSKLSKFLQNCSELSA